MISLEAAGPGARAPAGGPGRAGPESDRDRGITAWPPADCHSEASRDRHDNTDRGETSAASATAVMPLLTRSRREPRGHVGIHRSAVAAAAKQGRSLPA